MFRKVLSNTVLSVICVYCKIKTSRTQSVDLVKVCLRPNTFTHECVSTRTHFSIILVRRWHWCWCHRECCSPAKLLKLSSPQHLETLGSFCSILCYFFFIFVLALFFLLPSRTFFSSLYLIFVKQIFWGLHKSTLNLFKYMTFIILSNLISE